MMTIVPTCGSRKICGVYPCAFSILFDLPPSSAGALRHRERTLYFRQQDLCGIFLFLYCTSVFIGSFASSGAIWRPRILRSASDFDKCYYSIADEPGDKRRNRKIFRCKKQKNARITGKRIKNKRPKNKPFFRSFDDYPKLFTP